MTFSILYGGGGRPLFSALLWRALFLPFHRHVIKIIKDAIEISENIRITETGTLSGSMETEYRWDRPYAGRGWWMQRWVIFAGLICCYPWRGGLRVVWIIIECDIWFLSVFDWVFIRCSGLIFPGKFLGKWSFPDPRLGKLILDPMSSRKLPENQKHPENWNSTYLELDQIIELRWLNWDSQKRSSKRISIFKIWELFGWSYI